MRPAGVIALMWAGYAIGLYGWSLIRNYDVTFGQLVNPSQKWSGTGMSGTPPNPKTGKGGVQQWPPGTIPPIVVFGNGGLKPYPTPAAAGGVTTAPLAPGDPTPGTTSSGGKYA
jgi:hypothetical protein